MRSPAFGLGWFLWQKHRLGLSLFAVYMVVLGLASRLLPVGTSGPAMQLLTIPFGFGLLYLMGLFANTDTDLTSTRSGYAAPLFLLPVRTRSLIFWPMVYGVVIVALVWVAFAMLVLVPQGESALVWWPAALMAALTACLQALSWYPFPLPYLRGILAFAVLAALAGLGALGWARGVSPGLLGASFLTIIPFAALIAAHGVSLARTGENQERTWLPERRQDRRVRCGFVSPVQAQTWLEWKRNGLLLPLLTFLTCLLFALPIAFSGSNLPTNLGIGTIEVSFAARVWIVSVLWAPLTAMTIGCCPYKIETFRPDSTLQPFLATRPLSSVDIVQAKLRMAALSTLSTWGILGIFLAGWLLLPARDGAVTGTIGGLLARHITLNSVLLVALLFAAQVGSTWICQVSSLWVELSGRRWLIQGYSVGLPMLVGALIVVSVHKATTDPAFLTQAFHVLPYLACCLALLKVVLVTGAIHGLRRCKLMSDSALGRILSVWVLIATGIVGSLLWLLPPGLVPARDVALGVFLFLPLARLLAAPLSLHWNRHR